MSIPIFKVLLKLFGEKRFVKSVKLSTLSIKSINSIKEYLHIIESYVCVSKILLTIVNLSINFLFFYGMCSTTKL